MNIFYCNGIIPVLLSGALLKKKYANTRNAIIIELSDTRPLFIPASATSIYENKILDLLVECSQWDEVNKFSFIKAKPDLIDEVILDLEKCGSISAKDESILSPHILIGRITLIVSSFMKYNFCDL